MAKRKIPYGKIITGLDCCFKETGRECSDCPYDDYNDHDDWYGDAPMFCMEKMRKDVRRWTSELAGFCHCMDCAGWHRNWDGNEIHPEWDGKEGYCSTWETVMGADEFCSRGARSDDD